MQQPDDFQAPGATAKIYSREQHSALETHFKMDRYPSPEAQDALATRLKLKKSDVQLWFVKRRQAADCLEQKPASRVRRLQGLRSLPSSTDGTHFLLSSGPAARPAAALPREPEPRLQDQGSPEATPPAPNAPAAQGAFGTLQIFTGTPGFQEGVTPEDQNEPGPASLGSKS